MKKKWPFFIIASIGLVIVLLILNNIKKKVFITIDLEVLNAKMKINEDVLNFFSLQDSREYSEILVSAPHRFNVPSMNSDATMLPDTIDVLGRSKFKGIAPGRIDLKKNSSVTITAVDNKNVSLLIEGQKSSFIFSPVDSISKFTFDEGKRNDIEVDDDIQYPLKESVQVFSKNSVINIRLIAKDSLSLTEESIFSVTPVGFTRYVGNKKQPGILGGKMHIEETGKDIILYKNEFLSFGGNHHLTVTSLLVQNGKIKLHMEGFTDNVTIGVYGNKYIPSLLEYFSKNNQLVLLFNSFMVVITFILFLKRESSKGK